MSLSCPEFQIELTVRLDASLIGQKLQNSPSQ